MDLIKGGTAPRNFDCKNCNQNLGSSQRLSAIGAAMVECVCGGVVLEEGSSLAH